MAVLGVTGLLEGGVVVQRAIVAAALVGGGASAQHALLDEARNWLARHAARFWAAALSEVEFIMMWLVRIARGYRV